MSDHSTSSVEVNDGVFCHDHLKEVCDECKFDGREDNDTFYGLDPIPREPLTPPNATSNKDGVYICKKHSSSGCSQCFGWKKQISKLQKDAKKAGKNNKKTTNLY